MNSNSIKCKAYRERKRLYDDSFTNREKERHRNYRKRQRSQIGKGKSSVMDLIIQKGEDCKEESVSTSIEECDSCYELDAPHVILQHPFTMFIAGPTGSGKTHLVNRILKHRETMIKPDVQELIWFHGQDQPFHLTLKTNYPDMTFIDGLPDSINFDPTVRRLIIVDDLMGQVKGGTMGNLFTKGSHHTNTSVIFIVQNLFSQNSPEIRTMSLNCLYMIIMKNPRDKQQVGVLDTQMFPGKGRFLTSVYEDATKKPHGYLFIATNQYTHDDLRVRTHIFPDDSKNLVYIYCEN